jgi:hypothetical protein
MATGWTGASWEKVILTAYPVTAYRYICILVDKRTCWCILNSVDKKASIHIKILKHKNV